MRELADWLEEQAQWHWPVRNRAAAAMLRAQAAEIAELKTLIAQLTTTT